MSKQVQVFLTAADEESLFNALRDEHELVLARSVYWSDAERFVASLAELGKYPTDQQIGLTSPSFLPDLLVTSYTQGHTRLDLINSPVIEFTRCQSAPGRLHRGRFWYQLPSRDASKGDEFKLWVQSVFRSLRQHLTSIQTPIEALIGPEALAQVNDGLINLTV